MGLQSTAGSLQSLCWASAALGGVASAYFSGALIETWGPRGVFLLTAAFPLVVSAAAVLINEQPMSSGSSRLKADKDTASEAARCPLLAKPMHSVYILPALQRCTHVAGPSQWDASRLSAFYGESLDAAEAMDLVCPDHLFACRHAPE